MKTRGRVERVSLLVGDAKWKAMTFTGGRIRFIASGVIDKGRAVVLRGVVSVDLLKRIEIKHAAKGSQ